MAKKIILPKFGWTMTEGTIVKWHRQEGEKIEEGDVLLEITTDKSVTEVESPTSGIVLKILAPEGETKQVSEIIAIVGEIGEDISPLLREAAVSSVESVSTVADTAQTDDTKQAVVNADIENTVEIRATPAARTLAKRNNIALENVARQIRGLVKQSDIKKILEANEKDSDIAATPLAKSIIKKEDIDPSRIKGTGVSEKIMAADVRKVLESEKISVPLSGMRKTIATRMLFSSQNTAPVHYSVRIDMSNAEHLRTSIKALGIKVTYTDIVLKAAAKALNDFPNLNVSFGNGMMTPNENINIGIAVAIPNGLVVPVLKNVDLKSLKQIAIERTELIERSRAGRLTTQDMTGGSFTISNLGMYDIDKFNPIINPPEAAILGIGRTRDEAIVINKQIEIRPIAWFTLVAEHQLIDGAPAADFFQHLKQLIENPYIFLV